MCGNGGELERKLRQYLGKYLRRLYSHSPIKSAVFNERKTADGWSCYICEGVSSTRADFEVEHVSPVVPPDRDYVPSLEYFSRMFSLSSQGLDLSNLQLCCKGCHAVKTAEEDAERKAHGTGRFSSAARVKAAATRARRKLRPKRKASKHVSRKA